ncbi:MAG: trimethylamine corrinoid protein 2, partial [Clostridia bacterium]|nr:trimethylamine corrinoid protein 2 [Clostridia bacterium]
LILSVKGIDNIQWTHVAGQPKPSMFIPVLKKIQQAGKNLILIPTADEVPVLLDNLSSRGLHLLIADVTTVEDAQDLMVLIKKRSVVRD